MVKSCFCCEQKRFCWRKDVFISNSNVILSHISNRPWGQQHCVYFPQHVGQVKPGCIWIKSYQLISGLFQVILSDLLLKWVSVFVPVLVALHNQFVVNEIQINAIFSHDVTRHIAAPNPSLSVGSLGSDLMCIKLKY